MSASPPLPSDPCARPWGLAATFGFGLVVWYAFLLVQTAMLQGVPGLYAVLGVADDLPADHHGLTFSLVTCATSVLCGAIVVAAARLRDGLDVRDYLGLREAPPGQTKRWLGVTAVLVVQIGLVLYLVKGESGVASWLDTYRAAGVLSLFWLTLLVVAPVFEEILFRGFLFAGIAASRLGGRGAVWLTALLWTLMHGHEDPFDLLMTFVFGVVLGMARLRTGSIRTTVAMQALNSLAALLQLAWMAERG